MGDADTERLLRAVARHLDWRQGILVPEAPVRYLRAAGERFQRKCYFADLMWVSEAGRALEVELKVSRADWRADADKGKWGRMPGWVARFVYAVPAGLGIPPWVPEAAGVWHVRDGGHVHVARAPRVMGTQRVPAQVLAGWRSGLYFSYWLARLYEDRRLPSAGALVDDHLDSLRVARNIDGVVALRPVHLATDLHADHT